MLKCALGKKGLRGADIIRAAPMPNKTVDEVSRRFIEEDKSRSVLTFRVEE